MASLSFHEIVKQYPGNPNKTLDGISLEVASGELLVLVGPSGCGKSTLLRTIAGLESISSGTLKIGERVVNDVHPKDRDIAMVFQSYALYPHMTVRRNMAFGLEVRKTPRPEIDRLVNDAAQMLGLEPFLDKLPKQLSGGQRQRVAMGRAIVRRPSVFLFDEPLSNLDASLRNQMRVEIKRLHQQLATTMVYVTHDQVEAMTLADRIAVLNRGHLQQVGSPLDLFYNPQNRFVASFIGSPSMHFLPATLSPTADADTWTATLTPTSLSPTSPNSASPSATSSSTSSATTSAPLSIPFALPPSCPWRPTPQQAVTLGLRPQSLTLATPQTPASATLTATLDIVEMLGWEAHLHCRLPSGQALLAVVTAADASALRANSLIKLTVPPDELLAFDPQTDAALFTRPIKRSITPSQEPSI
jgi:ABC-type sugar transport system ATPase subunit